MWPSSKGEKRPADVINAAIIGKQRRHPDNSWEERVSPMTHASGVRSDKWTADVRDGSPEVAVAGQVQRLNPRLPQDRRAADGIREVDMAQTRGILLASIVLGLSVGMNPAAAQKKYDPGATDSEIKIGNIMPYSGPLSAYASMGGRSTSFPTTTPSARRRPWSRRASSWRAMRYYSYSRASERRPTTPFRNT